MRHSNLLFSLCLILGIATYFTSCEKKNDNETVYKGRVINTVTSTPFPNLEVKVTDGEHINATVKTDENGQFSILVKFNEINGNYYLLIGDASCVRVRRDFKGFGQAEINLGDIEVEGPKSATITTSSVSSITVESALSGGNITDDGRAEITARGVCWSKNEYPTINDSHTINGTGKGKFQSEIKGLEGGVTYYVRAYATNEIGTVYGLQLKFTTETGLPMVTTIGISNVTATSAICGGSVTNTYGHIIARGVCWSNNSSTPTIENDHTTEVAATGNFSSTIVNLDVNTTYYVRAYATNEKGTIYGKMVSFTTKSGLPVVVTTAVGENLTRTTITTGGQVTSDGGFPIQERGVVWSAFPYPTLEKDTYTVDGYGTGYYTSRIINVDTSTKTYYIRSYATNKNGTSYGEQITITPENYQYLSLKTFSLGGYTYRVYFGLGKLNWKDCETACKNLTFGGYSDWFLPNEQEGQAILEAYGVWGKNRGTLQGITEFWCDGYYNSYVYSCNSWGEYSWNYCYRHDRIYSSIAIRKYRN